MNYFVEVKEDLSMCGLPKGSLAEVAVADLSDEVTEGCDAIIVKTLNGSFTLLERHQYRNLDDSEDFNIQKAKIISLTITFVVLVLSICLLA